MNTRIAMLALIGLACSEPKKSGQAPASSAAEKAPAPTSTSTIAGQHVPDLVIEVGARKWAWDFTYPGGLVSRELHLPAETQVRLHLRSSDSEHIFSAEALGVTATIPAGGESTIDVAIGAPVTGEVRNAATGDPLNAKMRAPLVVAAADAHAVWLRESSADSRSAGRAPAEWGKALFEEMGCQQCHSIDGSTGVGPSLAGVWARTSAGKTRLADGRKVGQLIGAGRTHATVADYLKAEILDPSDAVVEGFAPVQPSFRGQLDEPALNALLAYLKTL